MFLARVKGHIVATAKDPAIRGKKLLVVEPLRVEYDHDHHAASGIGGGGRFDVTGRAIVVMDSIGAGEGQLVLVVLGTSARMADGMRDVPTDAAIIGIVDEAVIAGKKITGDERP